MTSFFSSSWMLSRTAARYWIPPSWSSSINTISYERDPQKPAYAPWRCVVKDTSKTCFLIRQYPFHGFPLFLIYMMCPCSTFTSLKYIEKIILALQGHLVTLIDLPTSAPSFFVSPARDDTETRAMLDGISWADIKPRCTGQRRGSDLRHQGMCKPSQTFCIPRIKRRGPNPPGL